MKDLSSNDLRTLVSAIEDLHADFDLPTLPERALSAASKVIAADSIAFTGIRYNGEYAGIGWENSGTISPEDIEIFAQYMHENPLFAAYIVERRSEALKITDLIAPKKFQRTAIYNEFYRRVGVRNQLVAPLSVSGDLLITCSINTSREDFTNRDKALLTLIAPHLINAIRNAFAYERLSSALETEACGVVAISAKGKPLFISEFARRLFEKYFAGEKRAADRLPETLAAWLKQKTLPGKTDEFALPPEPLKIENKKGVLTVRLMDNRAIRERTLLIEEKRFASMEMFDKFSLTRREAEIMFWITQGKTDDVIGTLLSISPRTVHKHVENIYAKLGVETRTSAMLRALEIL